MKDLGLAEQEIQENSYSKLGVISRINEPNVTGEIMGALGTLQEEKDDEGEKRRGLRFSIPTIVESFASIEVSITGLKPKLD